MWNTAPLVFSGSGSGEEGFTPLPPPASIGIDFGATPSNPALLPQVRAYAGNASPYYVTTFADNVDLDPVVTEPTVIDGQWANPEDATVAFSLDPIDPDNPVIPTTPILSSAESFSTNFTFTEGEEGFIIFAVAGGTPADGILLIMGEVSPNVYAMEFTTLVDGDFVSLGYDFIDVTQDVESELKVSWTETTGGSLSMQVEIDNVLVTTLGEEIEFATPTLIMLTRLDNTSIRKMLFNGATQEVQDVELTYSTCGPAPTMMRDSVMDVFRNSHKMEVRIKVANSDGGYMTFCDPAWSDPSWHLVSGNVKESLDDEVTRTLSAEVVADYWTSETDILADLSPYKTMLRVERGVRTPQGVVYAPLGVYRVFDVSVSNGKKASITAYSQEADLRDNRYITPPGVTQTPLTFAALLSPVGLVFGDMGTNAPNVEWIGDAMNSTAGRLKVMPSKTTLTTTRNRLELITRLAQSINADFYFTRANIPIFREKPDFDNAVELTINAVSTNANVNEPAILVSFSKKYTRNSVYNAVVASGTDTAGGASYRGIAYDNDILSPTRWDGPFGRKPRFYSSQFLRSDAQCVLTAQSLLAQANRLKSSLDFSFVPNPFVEVGDVIELAYPNGAVEKHIVRTLSIDLTAGGAMSSGTAADSNSQAEISVM